MARPKQEPKKRIQVTLSYELFDILKAEADLLGTSVPAVLVSNATEHLYQKMIINQLPDLMDKACKISDYMEKNPGKQKP